MKSIGLVVNISKDKNLKITNSIVNWIESKGMNPLLREDISELIKKPQHGKTKEYIYTNSDIIIVLGGDGTILGVARDAAAYGSPILGINLGHLGFLAEVEVKEIFESLEEILSNKMRIEERFMLDALVCRGDSSREFHCLNDIVISRGTLSRIITLNIYINQDYITTLKGDGIIIATPTGSTAYSLSAGGPIIDPNLSCISLTPICPHSISNRSTLVISENEVVKIDLSGNYGEAYLTVDGQEGYSIEEGEYVLIRKAPFKTKLIKLLNRSFYDVLKEKLTEK